MEKLKTCPFCGEDVSFSYNAGSYGYTPNTIHIKCCSVHMTEVSIKWEQGKGTFSIEDQAKIDLTKRWNTRTKD